MNTLSEGESTVGYSELFYPGTHTYNASLHGQIWNPRRRRSLDEEGEYDEYYPKAVTPTDDYHYGYDRAGRRSRNKIDLHVEQEASYLCHRRWFTAAEVEDSEHPFSPLILLGRR